MSKILLIEWRPEEYIPASLGAHGKHECVYIQVDTPLMLCEAWIFDDGDGPGNAPFNLFVRDHALPDRAYMWALGENDYEITGSLEHWLRELDS